VRLLLALGGTLLSGLLYSLAFPMPGWSGLAWVCLVPFSEFVPFAGLDLSRRSFGPVRFFSRGGPTPPLPTRAGPAGILVCNEAMLPEVARERVREGAAYLVNPSNDSWVERPRWARLMFDLVRLRAVEEPRWLVRASTSGPSAIVDPWGRVRAESRLFSQGLVLGGIHPRREPSVYGRVGDLFALGCAAAVGLRLLLPRRGRGPGSPSPAA
jgi:apolipoprotein N-acyltransferase